MIIHEQEFNDVDRDGNPRTWLQISVEVGPIFTSRRIGAKAVMSPPWSHERARRQILKSVRRRLQHDGLDHVLRVIDR
jgi:hypothetical protein